MGLACAGCGHYQTDNDVVIEASMPGIKSEDVDIQLNADVLTN
jgi:HSP20 family molecular chaperone IbpA